MTETLPQSVSTSGHAESEQVSVAVVRAVAEAKGVSPLDITPTLRSVLEPEALNRLVESMSDGPNEGEGFVEFTWCGYDIFVSGDGHVSVAER